jgi:acetyl esterase/lipase
VPCARIVLAAGEGLGNDQIAAALFVGRDVVSLWREHFFYERLAGLGERPPSCGLCGDPTRMVETRNLKSKRGFNVITRGIRTFARVTFAVGTAALLVASSGLAQTTVVLLYPSGAPGSEKWTQKELENKDSNGLRIIRNVVEPSLTTYLPPRDTATGAAVVIAPGGAFRLLSWDSEGTQVAEWLRQHGVAGFVLKYRLSDSGTGDNPFAGMGRGGAGGEAARGAAGGTGGAAGTGRGDVPPGVGAARGGSGAPAGQSEIRAIAAADGLRAIELVREHSAEWGLDPAKVGIMGFSAGGYVALQAATSHGGRNRPAFVGAIYACCTDPATLTIPEDAPPTFFLHAYNDPVSNSSPALFMAWKAAGKPAELHSYADGGHGFGMPKKDKPTDNWIERFGDWLRYQKLMK